MLESEHCSHDGFVAIDGERVNTTDDDTSRVTLDDYAITC